MMILAMLLQDVPQQVAVAQQGIGTYALLFMILSMGAVTLLTAWCFWRIFTTPKPQTPGGGDIVGPPVPNSAEGVPPRDR